MADDSELAAIRARRLAQMQAQGGAGGAGGQEQMKKQQEQMKQEQDMKNSMLAQILDQGARARLNSIALVKPEKARAIENMLIQMARSGQIGGKMSEEGLVGVLEKVNTQLVNKTTITRRRYAMDSDEDDDY